MAVQQHLHSHKHEDDEVESMIQETSWVSAFSKSTNFRLKIMFNTYTTFQRRLKIGQTSDNSLTLLQRITEYPEVNESMFSCAELPLLSTCLSLQLIKLEEPEGRGAHQPNEDVKAALAVIEALAFSVS
jgi:hypothetical protein